MIDACIHLATTDDLHMQFDIVISTENKTCTIQSQCTSNSTAIYMMVLKICTGVVEKYVRRKMYPRDIFF